MRGRLSTFIELGVGFNPDLAARDNVLINGIMLGLSPKEALRRFDAIIAFAELEEFVDLKLKNYSSGMQVRLAFSVMSQVDADILLIDEVLAVGDAAFQQKCFDVFQRLKDEGKTILFVTHDMGAVARFCDRAVLLERGRVELIGAAGRGRRALPAAQLRPRRRRDGAQRGGARRRRQRGDPRRLVRDRRRAHRRAAAGRRVHGLRAPPGPRAAARARGRRAARGRPPPPAVGRLQRGRRRALGRARAGRRGGLLRHLPQRLRARPRLPDAVDGARGRRADHRPPPAPRGRGGHGGAPLRRRSSTCPARCATTAACGRRHERRARPADRRPVAPWAGAGAASPTSRSRSPRPSSSCASSARRSATCGSSSGRCCSSASSTSCSPSS